MGLDNGHSADRTAGGTHAPGEHVGYWCASEGFLYWRKPEKVPHPDRGCDQPVVIGGDGQPPEGWAEVGFFPRARYFIVEQDDGWHAYVDDSDQGAFT